MRRIRVDQIDGDIWIILAENMKGKRDATTEFRVPFHLKKPYGKGEKFPTLIFIELVLSSL